MDYILVGTAGHVDHGKSTLIRALTGIDPDRLKEEKEREMTIDIGFANFILPSGRCAQFIDVPGHERFIKNMLAGVNTIDLVLFLVDANEGIKPQTQEHFAILKLLDIKTGIIVLTKIDLVTGERFEKVTQAVSELVKGSFLEKAPIIKVSSVTGEGITELTQTIDRLAPGIRKRDKNLPARLHIDRVFSMSGSGTVITGTLISGLLKINDVLEILPQKSQVRVRQIQSYGGKTTEAVAGQRVGINLVGVKKEDLMRGNTLAAPGYLEPTYMFNATLSIIPNSPFPLKNNTRVRLHTGTGEFLGRIVLLDKEKLEAGQQALIQFRAEIPLAVAKDDRFVIRLYAPMITVGGGLILDPHPPRHKRFQSEIVEQLEALKSATPKESVARVLINAGFNPLNQTEITAKVNLPQAEIAEVIKELEAKKEIIRLESEPDRIMHLHNFNLLKERIIQTIEEFYQKQPLRLNIPAKEIKIRLARDEWQAELFDRAAAELAGKKRIDIINDSLKLTQHSIPLTPRQEQLKQKIENFYLTNLFTPPGLAVLTQTLSIKPKTAEEMIAALKDMNILVDLSDGIILHKEAITKASELIKEYLSSHENIKAGEFTKLLNTSRKYAIPLLEYFDQIKLTKRVEDVRILY